MTNATEEKIVLVCTKCNVPLQTRVVSKMMKTSHPIMMRNKAELFCPQCGQITNAVNQFKKQRNAKREKNQS